MSSSQQYSEFRSGLLLFKCRLTHSCWILELGCLDLAESLLFHLSSSSQGDAIVDYSSCMLCKERTGAGMGQGAVAKRLCCSSLDGGDKKNWSSQKVRDPEDLITIEAGRK